MTPGMDFGCTERSNAALYNWKEQIQIQLTHNPPDGQACDEGESFWVARLPVDFSVTELAGKAPFTIELKSPKVDGEGWKWDFGDGASLFIGKIEVVNNDGMHAPKEESGSIRLKAGRRPIRVYFMQGGGGSALSASYEGPGIAKSEIPSQALFRDAELRRGTVKKSGRIWRNCPKEMKEKISWPGRRIRIAWQGTDGSANVFVWAVLPASV